MPEYHAGPGLVINNEGRYKPQKFSMFFWECLNCYQFSQVIFLSPKSVGARSFGRPPDVKSHEKALTQAKASLRHPFS
jgi:hypothetical protein